MSDKNKIRKGFSELRSFNPLFIPATAGIFFCGREGALFLALFLP
jgi:hypothetical protein